MFYIEVFLPKVPQPLLIDLDDYDIFKSKDKWYYQKAYNRLMAFNTPYYIRRVSKPIYLHRLIVKAQKGELVDHKNHNGMDNRRNNLRRCSSSENVRNSQKKAGCSSIYRGVYWHKKTKKWIVTFKNPETRKTTVVGNFNDEIEAAKAFDKVVKKFHGEFACLNFKD